MDPTYLYKYDLSVTKYPNQRSYEDIVVTYELTLGMLQGIYSYMELLYQYNLPTINYIIGPAYTGSGSLPGLLPISKVIPIPVFKSHNPLPLYAKYKSQSYHIAVSDPLSYRSEPNTRELYGEIPKIIDSSTPYEGYVLGVDKEGNKFITVLTHNLQEYIQGLLLADHIMRSSLKTSPSIRLYLAPNYVDYVMINQLSGFPLFSLPLELVSIITGYNACEWLSVNKRLKQLANSMKYVGERAINNKWRLSSSIQRKLRRKDYSDIDAIINGVNYGSIEIGSLLKYLHKGTEKLIDAISKKLLQTDDSLLDLTGYLSNASSEFLDHFLPLITPQIMNASSDVLTNIKRNPIIVDLMTRGILYPEINNMDDLSNLLSARISMDKLIVLTDRVMNGTSGINIPEVRYLSMLIYYLIDQTREDEDEYDISYVPGGRYMKFIRWLYANVYRVPIELYDSLVSLLYQIRITYDSTFAYNAITQLLTSDNLSRQSYERLQDIVDKGMEDYGFPDEFEPIQDRLIDMIGKF